jgi:branched-chain amino acid transport system permease protein
MTTPTQAVAAIRRAKRPPTGIRAIRAKVPPSVEVMVGCVAVALVGGLLFEGSILFLFTTAVIYALFASSTNILFGWTGVSSFGQAAYFGVGAYTVGLMKDLIENPVLAIVLGMVAAAVIAGAYALLASRITGTEFAMLTLIFGQILWLLTFRIPELRGENGIPAISRGELFGVNLFDNQAFWWYIVAIVTISLLVLRRIRGSSLGAAMNAVRDDPIRAEALGISVRWVRVWAFMLAGAFAGLAGALMAQHQGLVTPEMIAWGLSGEVIVMCLIGGMRSFWGPAIGAILLVLVKYFLLDATSAPDLWVGIALLVIVLVVPGGLLSVPRRISDAVQRRKKEANR